MTISLSKYPASLPLCSLAIFIALMMACTLCGCTSADNKKKMEAVERLLPEFPDSARSIIESIDIRKIHGDRDKAIYALLTADARYRTREEDTTYEYLQPALDYFSTHQDSRRAARTYYLAGHIDHLAGKTHEAIVNFLKSEARAEEVGDLRQKGLAESHLGLTYDLIYDWGSSETYFALAYESFNEIKDTFYLDYAVSDLARCKLASADYDSCMLLIKDILPKIRAKGNDVAEAELYGMMGTACYYSDKNVEAARYFARQYDMNPEAMDEKAWLHRGLNFVKLHQLDSAKMALKELEKMGLYEADPQHVIEAAEGQYHKAYEALRQMLSTHNSEIETALNRNYARSVRDYLGQEEAQYKNSLRKERLIKWGVVAGLLCILAFIVLSSYYHLKRYKLKMDSDVAMIENLGPQLDINRSSLIYAQEKLKKLEEDRRSLKSVIAELEVKISSVNKESAENSEIYQEEILVRNNEMQSLKAVLEDMKHQIKALEDELSTATSCTEMKIKVRQLLKDRFALYEELCAQYHQYGDDARKKSKIHKKLIEKIENTLEEVDMPKLIDDNYNGMYERFRADYPTMKDWEYKLFQFVVLDFTPITSSIILQLSVDQIYLRKSRLKRKLKKSDVAGKEEYLEFFT